MTASRLRTFLFVTSALIAAAITQAQQPAGSKAAGAATTSPTPATSRSAPKGAADAKTGSAPTQVASTQKPDSGAQLIKDARSAGFKPENIRGSMMFCRTAIELGSSFPVRTCYNAEQVKIKIHEYQTQRNQLEQMHSTGLWNN